MLERQDDEKIARREMRREARDEEELVRCLEKDQMNQKSSASTVSSRTRTPPEKTNADPSF